VGVPLATFLRRSDRKSVHPRPETDKPERCSWSAEFIPQERGMFKRAADFHRAPALPGGHSSV